MMGRKLFTVTRLGVYRMDEFDLVRSVLVVLKVNDLVGSVNSSEAKCLPRKMRSI